MNDRKTSAGVRRVILGDDASGRSAVLSDEHLGSRSVRPNGAVIEEIWRQEVVPAEIGDDGRRVGGVDLDLPPAGLSVRKFSIPADTTETDLVLNASDSVFVATVVAGTAHLVLETGEVELARGDCFVLPGSKHAWRNPHREVAEIVTTVFARKPAIWSVQRHPAAHPRLSSA
ncbi:hypothetical protein CH253_18575 [Rhodococcus sp. 06-156-3C]|uniref:hypothetical protein n=1 Tax=Nocardiaceae TaxID=85025 RepID=UPI000522FDA3|nr:MULTISPECIES: hypothetical protein [Rhodococcus]OZD13068.1 hypothetical protein CH248_27775 [Rhodococcus sp. 06-156-4a]OZD17937.1 hypothetical protein CH253_18575 [Rhodococcus sp. 06-156-3C]OZD20661.1 hypothetical protein CH280_03730 [Rhodococcus sp. 06-156-4C]OZD30621.1 hypothetical protein CH247_15000 [Rhodococcus sp. 06-156-3b]OZD32607.1 hypothetical protein CH284_20260 [Rhodococcus sp. 06-156-3]